MGGVEIALIVVVAAFVALLFRTFRIVPQARIGVIQRLGNFHIAAESGLVVVLPFIDKMLPLLDMREQVVSFAPQPVITSDNVTINVTSVIYYQILNARCHLSGGELADGHGADRSNIAAQCDGELDARHESD